MHLPAASGTSQAHHRTLWVHADVSAALRYSPVPSKPASPSSWELRYAVVAVVSVISLILMFPLHTMAFN